MSNEVNPITKAFTKAVLNPLDKKIKELEAENKVYKGMWKELKKTIKNLRFNNEYLLQEIKILENKYLGGEE